MAETESVDKEYKRYCAEIDLYEKEFRSWEARGKNIVKLFKDADNVRGKKKRFNILWSNVETLKPALYARDPQPEAERRFKDSDPVGRTASEVLERCISYTIDCHGFGAVMRQVRDDRLLPGRGVAWVRYQATIDEPEQKEGEQLTDDAGEVTYEQAIPDYVYWQDFGHNIARTWEEVTLVWRKVYMSRKQLVKRFPDKGQEIPLDYTPKGLKDEKIAEDIKKACIYELWDRDEKQVVFLSKSFPEVIESDPDPLSLTGMFPCPKPLFATLTTDSLVPTPDYALYQTQAQEIEDLTARINALQKALKLAGVYDTSAPELARLLNEGYENKLIPVDSWAQFAEKGGLDGAIDFLPIKEVAETLIAMYEAREKSKEDLYELTGLADIIRGHSDPRETAKAQQIKGQFAVLRISDSQQDVQRFARDLIRLLGEIIAEHFSLETIQAISGVKLLSQAEKGVIEQQMKQAQMIAQQTGQQPPPLPDEVSELMDQPTWEEVYELLQHQVLREFRIDIETDSTIRTDEDMERQSRIEFLTAAGQFVERGAQAAQLSPALGPLMAEMLMFGVRSYRSARTLEPVFEDAMKQLNKPQEGKPDPEMAKVQGELEIKREEAKLKAQTEQQVQQAQHEQEMARQQMEDQRAERDAEREMAVEKYKADLQIQVQREKNSMEAELKRLEIASNERIAERQAEHQDKQAEAQMASAERQAKDKNKTAERIATKKPGKEK